MRTSNAKAVGLHSQFDSVRSPISLPELKKLREKHLQSRPPSHEILARTAWARELDRIQLWIDLTESTYGQWEGGVA